MTSPLVVGPVLRYVDGTTAAVWLESRGTARVRLLADGRSWETRTFCVHGHHYALIQVDGLRPGSVQDYSIEIDDQPVWPPAGSQFPPSRIATLKPGKDLRLAFGSCRTSVSHDEAGNRAHGVDALRAYALHMASGDHDKWPDLVLFLGDQVYADETSDEMRDFIRMRRDIDEPPGEELKDFEEYAHLYRLAWTDPANRWLLSTLPSAMIFDDHDIRDDWNTSLSWRHEITQTSWWRDRIVGGLASYWVYQHLGNLSPADRAEDPVWQQVVKIQQTGGSDDLGDFLDSVAEQSDDDPTCYRWSYARDIGSVRLIVVDSRAARVLTPNLRSILDEAEMRWLDQQMRGDFDHLLIGTSLPFLLSPGLHHFEAWNEAVATGAWGKRWARWSEKIRRAVDMEHWAAFQEGFISVARQVTAIADGQRGAAPATIVFLSGDVHHSYVAEVVRDGGSRILQAVCSPIRNPLPRAVRVAMAGSAYRVPARIGRRFARAARVPDPPIEWKSVKGPWFDNNLATLETHGRDLTMRWETGVVVDGRHQSPELEVVADVSVPERRP